MVYAVWVVAHECVVFVVWRGRCVGVFAMDAVILVGDGVACYVCFIQCGVWVCAVCGLYRRGCVWCMCCGVWCVVWG